jgi:hypothetical protein
MPFTCDTPSVGALCLLLLVQCANDRREDRPPATTRAGLDSLRQSASADSANSQTRSGVLYYGVSATGGAWLVSIDFGRGEGVRYDALKNPRLCAVSRGSSGAVSWSSVPDGGIIERFEGSSGPGSLTGVMTFKEAGTGRVVRTWDLRLDSLSLPSPSADTLAGVYSSVGYVEEAGDLVGAEVVILRSGNDPSIIITKFEGTPSAPYAMADVQWFGDTVSGAYGFPRPSRIKLVRQGNTFVLRSGTVLKKQGTLRELLRPKAQAACRDVR